MKDDAIKPRWYGYCYAPKCGTFALSLTRKGLRAWKEEHLKEQPEHQPVMLYYIAKLTVIR